MADMNFMEKLLEGADVAWKPLGEVATSRRGRVMSKGYLSDNWVNTPYTAPKQQITA